MTALPDQCFDFDSELEPATPAIFSVFAWPRRTRIDPDYVDELQAWADGVDRQPRWPAPQPVADALLDVVMQVNVAAGEYFRGRWRRRLADAQGDCGYVARQMRKAGVPLDLALAVLLMPQPLLEAAKKSSLTPTSRADSHQGIAAFGDLQREVLPRLGPAVHEVWCDTDADAPNVAPPQPPCPSGQSMAFSGATPSAAKAHGLPAGRA